MIIGICFGSQIVARALGGAVVPNRDIWEIGVTDIQTTYMGKLIYGVEKLVCKSKLQLYKKTSNNVFGEFDTIPSGSCRTRFTERFPGSRRTLSYR